VEVTGPNCRKAKPNEINESLTLSFGYVTLGFPFDAGRMEAF
jgi:hypothetical protein